MSKQVKVRVKKEGHAKVVAGKVGRIIDCREVDADAEIYLYIVSVNGLRLQMYADEFEVIAA